MIGMCIKDCIGDMIFLAIATLMSLIRLNNMEILVFCVIVV